MTQQALPATSTAAPQRTIERSKQLFQEAVKLIPGGVNSPVRAFRSVGGDPLFMERGAGSRLYDADGNAYIDCIGSWGPLLLGHLHPEVVAAVHSQLDRGMTFGAPTRLEIDLAERICEAVPSVEKVRMVSSGTEATMSAIRVARGFTGREKIVKFEGCYHGHADFLLAKAGSGVATLGLPECSGVPFTVTADTITIPFNDISALNAVFSRDDYEIACVIVEPVVGNMGCVPPAPGYLEALREITQKAGAVLIFDEVMTGFRLAYGGAQQRYGVTPDMTTLGKIAGGGMPLGAYGGRAEIMDCVAPLGPVYQAGTLSGNPIAVTAGLTTLNILLEQKDTLYADLDAAGAELATSLINSAEAAGVPLVVNNVGSMITAFFTEANEVTDFASAKTCDTARFAAWHRSMLESGIYWPPSQFEAAFLSAAMSAEDRAAIADAAASAFSKL